MLPLDILVHRGAHRTTQPSRLLKERELPKLRARIATNGDVCCALCIGNVYLVEPLAQCDVRGQQNLAVLSVSRAHWIGRRCLRQKQDRVGIVVSDLLGRQLNQLGVALLHERLRHPGEAVHGN